VPGGREVVAVTYHEGEAAGEPRHARPIESSLEALRGIGVEVRAREEVGWRVDSAVWPLSNAPRAVLFCAGK
jgi:hypothetical protein